MDEQTNKELSQVDEQNVGVSSLTDTMTTATLRKGVKAATDQREIIVKYVKDHLKKGADYGQIGTFKKDVLFKPGQEKIFSLMNLTSRLDKDTDTIEMLGNQPGVIAYLCRVYRGGVEVAQGRGAAKVGENGRDINSTIKIAEKRARMDACLSLGFSEFFTQDLEDPEYRATANGEQPATAPKSNAASPKQRDYVKSIVQEFLKKHGTISGKQYLQFMADNGIPSVTDMTSEQASAFIENSKAGKLKPPAQQEAVDPEPADDEVIEGEIVEDPKGTLADRLAVAKNTLIMEYNIDEPDADLVMKHWASGAPLDGTSDIAVQRIEKSIKNGIKYTKEALAFAKEAQSE